MPFRSSAATKGLVSAGHSIFRFRMHAPPCGNRRSDRGGLDKDNRATLLPRPRGVGSAKIAKTGPFDSRILVLGNHNPTGASKHPTRPVKPPRPIGSGRAVDCSALGSVAAAHHVGTCTTANKAKRTVIGHAARGVASKSGHCVASAGSAALGFVACGNGIGRPRRNRSNESVLTMSTRTAKNASQPAN